MNETKKHPATEPEGQWVGTEKKRYSFVLKYLNGNSTRRGYHVHSFEDRNNSRFLCFDNRERITVVDEHDIIEGMPDKELVSGDCFTCDATINRHSVNTYKYGSGQPFKETVLNRIKFGKYLGRVSIGDPSQVAD